MGKAWTFGENMNTDEIIPGRYNITINPLELARNVFCEVKPEYTIGVKPGDVIVGGQNFGCGSSREHAPIAIKGAGVACVVAKSYARIFYRNAINIGMPTVECPEAVDEAEDGDILEIDTTEGVVVNVRTGKSYDATQHSPYVQQIIASGGLMNAVTERVKSPEASS